MVKRLYTGNIHMHAFSTQAAEVGAVSFAFQVSDHFVTDGAGAYPQRLF